MYRSAPSSQFFGGAYFATAPPRVYDTLMDVVADMCDICSWAVLWD